MDKNNTYKQALEYFNGDEMAANVWHDKYKLKDEPETVEMFFERLSKTIYEKERFYRNGLDYDTIYNLLKDFRYMVLGGSIMAGLGNRKQLTSLANCFVIDGATDSFGGIFRTDEEQAQLMKRRGGVGHDLSKIRPVGVMANNLKLTNKNGIYSYMQRYSNTTNEVSQGGRRGALMLTIDVKHPDTDVFVDRKMNLTDVTGANVSVKVNKEFLDCVVKDEYFVQHFPVYSEISEIKKITYIDSIEKGVFKVNELFTDTDTNGKKIYIKVIKAVELFNKIVNNALKSAEPGILYWDNAQKESPADYYGEKYAIKSTNPCGEQTLGAYDSCRLASMNLVNYIENAFSDNAYFDFNNFILDVHRAMSIMDTIIDIEIEHIDRIIEKVRLEEETLETSVEVRLWEKVRDTAKKLRRTGLGLTGLGDVFAMLGLQYGSEQSIELSNLIYYELAKNSHICSVQLAKDRGAFEIFDIEKDFNIPILQRLKITNYSDYQEYGRRNIACNTIAPNGSVSILTQTTSGVEPLFMPYYTRRKRVVKASDIVSFVDANGEQWTETFVIHKPLVDFAKTVLPHEYSRFENAKDIQEKKDILKTIFELSPYFNSTAHDVTPYDKLRVIAALQKWCDSAISSTTNLPKTTTAKDIKELYLKGHSFGLKGITIYVDGSRDGVLISSENTKKVEENVNKTVFKRDEILKCDVHESTAKGIKYLIFIGLDKNNKPFEVFAYERNILKVVPKHGFIKKTKDKKYQFLTENKNVLIDDLADISGDVESTVLLLVSGLLRHNMDIQYIVKTLRKSKGDITSFAPVVARVLNKYIKETERKHGEKCPQCGSKNVIKEDGCTKCLDCGHSKCA